MLSSHLLTVFVVVVHCIVQDVTMFVANRVRPVKIVVDVRILNASEDLDVFENVEVSSIS